MVRIFVAMSTPKNSRRRWTEDTIESELRAQQDALGHFPSRAELVSQGLRGLWDAATRLGGIEAWKGRLACPEAHAGRSTPPTHTITITDRRRPQDRVAEAAYYRWLSGAGGDEVEHWLEAERELETEATVAVVR